MDEQDAIPRQEALAGVGIIAALSIALVATMVLRIVGSTPETPRRPATASMWAAQTESALATDVAFDEAPAPLGEAAGDSAEIVAEPFPTATPIPTADTKSVSMPAASLSPTFELPIEQQPEPLERPVFIAPAGH
jgi:hypothetical protein